MLTIHCVDVLCVVFNLLLLPISLEIISNITQNFKTSKMLNISIFINFFSNLNGKSVVNMAILSFIITETTQ